MMIKNKLKTYTTNLMNKLNDTKIEDLGYNLHLFNKKHIAPYLITGTLAGIGFAGMFLGNMVHVNTPNEIRIKEINYEINSHNIESMLNDSTMMYVADLVHEKKELSNSDEFKKQREEADKLDAKIKTYSSLGGAGLTIPFTMYVTGLALGRRKEKRLEKKKKQF
ncbi:hypothetical protein K9L67_04945 [Candidatus Woesearchaeota archaeon]|nr:hypothetical protein [Candidatus Woesearchaeota archaeon]MCF8013959.1 hypothetical protein [Candidatus Woesearchaeota archaeon]